MESRISCAVGICSFFVLLFVVHSTAVKCSTDSQVGELCELQVRELKPTQFAVGEGEVKCKRGRIESMSKKKLKEWLEDQDRHVPVVIGPSGKFFMLDKHHTVRALCEANVNEDSKVMICEVRHKWHEDREGFWEKMVVNGLMWLYDQKGLFPMTPALIPTEIKLLLDDPYRTLAWMVRVNGGFAKIDAHFAEFQWANFFREKVPIKMLRDISDSLLPFAINQSKSEWCEVDPYAPDCLPNQAEVLENVLPLAMKWAQSNDARDLPGYGEGTVTPPKCGDNYRNVESKVQ